MLTKGGTYFCSLQKVGNVSINVHHLILVKSHFCNHLLDNNDQCYFSMTHFLSQHHSFFCASVYAYTPSFEFVCFFYFLYKLFIMANLQQSASSALAESLMDEAPDFSTNQLSNLPNLNTILAHPMHLTKEWHVEIPMRRMRIPIPGDFG